MKSKRKHSLKHTDSSERKDLPNAPSNNILMYEVDSEDAARTDFRGTGETSETFEDRLKADDSSGTNVISETSSAFGCKEVRFESKPRQPSAQKRQDNRNMKAHLKERKEARRSLAGISEKKKAVFWRGKR